MKLIPVRLVFFRSQIHNESVICIEEFLGEIEVHQR